MSLSNDFTLSSIQYATSNLREMALDHSEQRCVLRMGLSEAYRDFNCDDCELKHVDENS